MEYRYYINLRGMDAVLYKSSGKELACSLKKSMHSLYRPVPSRPSEVRDSGIGNYAMR